MKRKISKGDVAKALSRLEARGEKPTLDAIRAELGHQGSKSTIVKFLHLIKQEQVPYTNEDSRKRSVSSLLSDSVILDKLVDTDDLEGVVQSLMVTQPGFENQSELITDLWVVIKHLKLEVRQCHSEIDAIRKLNKTAFDALRLAIRT